MTRVGASIYQNEPWAAVSSIGTGASDGWTRILVLPQSALPNQSGSDAYVFTAWCALGSFTWTVSLTQHTVCEVAVGTDLAPFGDAYRHRVLFSDARLQRQRAMVPAFFMYSAVAGIGGPWPSNARGFALWARIFTNGDPSNLIQGSFRVSNMGIQAFSLVSLTTQQYLVERFAVQTTLQPGPPTQNLFATSQSGRFQAAGTWLCFTKVRHWPGVHGPPSLRINKSSDGGWVNVSPGFGRGGRFGSRARYQVGGASSLGRWDQLIQGGFFTWASPPTAGQLVLQAYDPLGFAGADPRNCAVAEWEIFAIRADTALGRFASLSEDPPSAVNLFNAVGVPTIVSENVEWSRPFDEDTEVVFNAAPASINADPSFHPIIATNLAGGARQGLGAIVATNYSEQHACIGTRYVALRPGEIQFKFYGYQNTFETPDSGYREPRDFTAASWAWENDPDTSIIPLPILPEITLLIPGRESLDASLLSALPIAPDIGVEEVFETVKTTFTASDGTEITWPKWLGVRRSLRFSWSSLTVAQRDTLTSFLRSNRSFKWTHYDDGTVLPLALVGGVQTEDVGVLHRISVQAIELVWTGSGA